MVSLVPLFAPFAILDMNFHIQTSNIPNLVLIACTKYSLVSGYFSKFCIYRVDRYLTSNDGQGMDNTNHLVVRKQVEINLSISSSDTTTVAVMEMPLKKVELQADVYMVCLQHALSTENFEVMGLLIGNLESGVANISAVKILRRSDKKKDRVEISSEQVLKAAAEAERLTVKLKRPMRVLGWYHSHPHITVWPSHVDVRTQATYQTMDHGFVGLIFSVFSEGKDSKEQEALVTCFQSHNGEATEIPLEIQYTPVLSEHCLKTMTELPKILVQEEEDSAETCKDHPDLLATIHNNAVHTKALAHITDIITRPLLSTFEKRLALNKMRIIYLQRQLEELQEIHIKSMNDSWSE